MLPGHLAQALGEPLPILGDGLHPAYGLGHRPGFAARGAAHFIGRLDGLERLGFKPQHAGIPEHRRGAGGGFIPGDEPVETHVEEGRHVAHEHPDVAAVDHAPRGAQADASGADGRRAGVRPSMFRMMAGGAGDGFRGTENRIKKQQAAQHHLVAGRRIVRWSGYTERQGLQLHWHGLPGKDGKAEAGPKDKRLEDERHKT